MGAERKKLNELAIEYEQQGYDVLIEPQGESLPEELRGYNPDILARKGDKLIVVEVKTRENLEREDDLVELSKRLEGNKDWHLELVVINPRKLHSEKKGGRAAITWDEITNKANEANELLAQGYKDAALLLAWIAVEGAMRQIAQDEQLASRSRSTSELIKSLAVYGLITKNDYKNIESAFQARNEIAHGYSSHRTGHPMAERVLKILPKLEKERANTPR